MFSIEWQKIILHLHLIIYQTLLSKPTKDLEIFVINNLSPHAPSLCFSIVLITMYYGLPSQ